MNIQEKIVEFNKLKSEIYEKVYAVNQIMGKFESKSYYRTFNSYYNSFIGEGHIYDFEPDFVIMKVDDNVNGNDYYNIPLSYLNFDLTTYSGFRGLVKAIKADDKKAKEEAKRKQEAMKKAQTEKQIAEEKALYESLRKKFENS